MLFVNSLMVDDCSSVSVVAWLLLVACCLLLVVRRASCVCRSLFDLFVVYCSLCVDCLLFAGWSFVACLLLVVVVCWCLVLSTVAYRVDLIVCG